MADKSHEVTLVIAAKVDGVRRSAGWTGNVTETAHGHLVEARAVAGSEDSADRRSRPSIVGDLARRLADAREHADDLQEQLDKLQQETDQRIADIQTAADKRISEAEATAVKQVEVAQKSADDKVTAIQTELEALKASQTKPAK
jgi:DNA anti-recombination protein RmuC